MQKFVIRVKTSHEGDKVGYRVPLEEKDNFNEGLSIPYPIENDHMLLEKDYPIEAFADVVFTPDLGEIITGKRIKLPSQLMSLKYIGERVRIVTVNGKKIAVVVSASVGNDKNISYLASLFTYDLHHGDHLPDGEYAREHFRETIIAAGFADPVTGAIPEVSDKSLEFIGEDQRV